MLHKLGALAIALDSIFARNSCSLYELMFASSSAVNPVSSLRGSRRVFAMVSPYLFVGFSVCRLLIFRIILCSRARHRLQVTASHTSVSPAPAVGGFPVQTATVPAARWQVM